MGISSALWPLFGHVWPMSKILANIMLTEIIGDKRILELGCGMALPSIVIKQLGGNITASDYHPLAGNFLARNAILNSLAKIKFAAGDWNTISKDLGLFDLIIGSDILYEEQHIELLSSFISKHSSRDAEVIIVDPGRSFHRKFAKAMQDLGYQHSWTNLELYSEKNKISKGFILRFTRTS